MNLKNASTKEVRAELTKREGVITIQVEPYEKIEVGGVVVDGPAIILVHKE